MDTIIEVDQPILVTGSAGFIGRSLVAALLRLGFTNVRCLVRPSGDVSELEKVGREFGRKLQIVRGNLLSRQDCDAITNGAAVIYHLAAGTGTKSFADAFANSVVTTRNLLDAAVGHGNLRRFVSVSSFAVYDVKSSITPGVLDETCPTEARPEQLGAYSFAKCKQDELVADYAQKHGVRYVLVRPGVVYGPGKKRIHGRIGLDTFGLFLHLGGNNPIPLSFVENCADAIALAGIKPGVDNEIFNVVDDDLPSSREFLQRYKREVENFRSVYLPPAISYFLCALWEKYSNWSNGQLPPVYNRKVWANSWKRTSYPNNKMKERLGWTQRVATADALTEYFTTWRKTLAHA